MTEEVLSHLLQQKIRDRFARVQIVGGGAASVSGADGTFGVGLRQPIPIMRRETVPLPLGLPPFEVLRGHDGAPARLRVNWLESMNGTKWKVGGHDPSNAPHVDISLVGGKKVYAVATVASNAGDFRGRGGGGLTSKLFTNVMVESLSLVVVGYDAGPPANSGGFDILSLTETGSATVHALLARYLEDGTEDPPYPLDSPHAGTYAAWREAEHIDDMPFQSGDYGWGHQFTPLSPAVLARFSILDLLSL